MFLFYCDLSNNLNYHRGIMIFKLHYDKQIYNEFLYPCSSLEYGNIQSLLYESKRI